MNYTQTTPKLFKTKSLSKSKLQFSQVLYSYHNFVQMKVSFKVTNTSLNINKRKLIKKLPKTYPPHGSPNNQKETKSHGSPCDSTINHKETTSHGSPCDSTMNHKETISHGSPCDSTMNHKKTTSHGAHDISQCTMTKLWNPTPNLSH
jgi:hypothetical protein